MSRANEIAIAYAKGLADAVRKKNTASLFGAKDVTVEPDAMGDTDIDDGTIEEILAAQSAPEDLDEPASPMQPGDVPAAAEDPDDVEKKFKKPSR